MYSTLFARKAIKDNLYWDGILHISSVLNKGLHEILNVQPVIIFIIFFNRNTFPLSDNFPQDIILYSMTMKLS
jgi:hypothetical protein